MSFALAEEEARVTRIRELNDAFRTTFAGGRVMMTASLAEMEAGIRAAVLKAVVDFDAFTPDNDPHKEHDWGSFQLFGRTWNWKLDYYDKALEFGSEDPSDPSKTIRVLTIGLADDF